MNLIKNKNVFIEYLAAISISLAILAGGFAYLFYTKWKDAEDKINIFESQSGLFTKHSEAIYYNVQKELEATTDQLNTVLDSNTNTIKLKSLLTAPNAFGKIYLNKESKKLYLSANNLPPAPENMNYELWGEIKDNYTTAGILRLNEPIQKMNYIEKTNTFIITLENKGQRNSPSLNNIYLMSP